MFAVCCVVAKHCNSFACMFVVYCVVATFSFHLNYYCVHISGCGEMATFSKSFICEFIEIMRNEPALWKTKSDVYKNKVEKNKSWKRLLSKYKEIEKDATIDDVKRKVNSLRASYRREFQKVRKSEKSGSAADEIYLPSLWYYNNLKFLRDQEEQMKEFETFDETLCAPKKRKIDDTILLQKAVEHLEKSTNQPERDEADVYSQSWAMTFRQLDREQKIYAKRIIEEILMHAQLGKLSYSSNLQIVQLLASMESDEIKTESRPQPEEFNVVDNYEIAAEDVFIS